MTNSEKAREYAAEKFKATESKKWNITTTYMSACEWKDQQFKEYLEKKLNEQTEHFKNERILYDRYDWVTEGKMEIIKEIINELFKEEKK